MTFNSIKQSNQLPFIGLETSSYKTENSNNKKKEKTN